VRARRRLQEVQQGEILSDLEAMRAEVARRDERDLGRETSPLSAAADAIRIDSTTLSADRVVRLMLAEAHKLLKPDKS
jgi:cytidylate kinase